jgi:hypothetical protein
MSPAVPQIMLPGLLLSGGGYMALRRSGYSNVIAAVLLIALGSQAGTLAAIAMPGHSLWLSVGVAGLAASSTAFAAQESLRRLILFSAALAIIQICDPMGALLAVGMLPAGIVIGGRHHRGREAVGLYALVFFLPVLTAGMLFYFVALRGFQLLPPPGPWLGFHTATGLAARMATVLAPIVIAIPALALSQLPPRPRVHAAEKSYGKPLGRALLFVPLAFAFAGLAAVTRGTIREPITLLAAAAPLSGAAIAALPAGRWRVQLALLAAALCLALSWAVLVLIGR